MGIFSKKDKADEAAQDSKHETPVQPPPKYQEATEEEVADLTAAIRNLDLDVERSLTALPSKDECIAHLKFLTSLAHLREEISETDGLWGITDDLADRYVEDHPSTSREEVLAKLREKRWAVYVTRAVDRFRKWWDLCLPTVPIGTGEGGTVSMDDIMKDSIFTPDQLATLKQTALKWKPEVMPPLDVLMVFHSFMLNPRDFLEDCIRQCRLNVWITGMPWSQVDACIDNTSFDYNPSAAAVSNFESMTGFPFDNLDGSSMKGLTCFGCKKLIEGAYHEPNFGWDIKEPFCPARGFADKNMEVSCPNCHFITTHETLRLIKFREDVERLLKYNTPLPGTILSAKGLAEKDPLARAFNDNFFPNYLIQSELRSQVLDLTGKGSIEDKKFDDVRDLIEKKIISRSVLHEMSKRKMKNPFRPRMLMPNERIAVRRMMSRYWENSSPFALDLTGAVIRQGIFVDKMAKLDWIHSPALTTTITRLIAKYEIFFRIISENHDQMAVPTLDVDLAWHTHQLTPSHYYTYSLTHMKDEFVDHNDKVDENKLSEAFAWTSKQYQKLTNGGIYSACTCWYCEATREATYSAFSAQSRAAQRNAQALHDDPAVGSDPGAANPHISAHNAVRQRSAAAASIARGQRYKLHADYERACKRARRHGRVPPDRDAYLYAYAWGYPMFVPMGYYPYMADPCISAGAMGGGGMYAYNPACINSTPGAQGNCAMGSCGGAAAAGACAGAAGGACGGGGGGCGGGGGGGCGGGGGGGGGGGCGGGGGG